MLENSFKHATHERLKGKYHRPDWWAAAPLSAHDQAKVSKATGEACRDKSWPSADDVAAQLTLCTTSLSFIAILLPITRRFTA